MRVLVRPAAAADIEDAYHWYEGQRPGLGEEFLIAVDAAKNRIANDPVKFPVIHRETRRVLLRRFPYGLYYRVLEDTVVIVACMHGRRDPRRWRKRV
jgi:plasmid stabilization system protein ParE